MNLWRVSVPGSSANLGAGFDTLALALEIFLDATAGPRWGDGRAYVSGPQVKGLPGDDSNLVWRAFSQAFRSRGKEPPDFNFQLHNEIPLECGLGSSAAAAVAGTVLANLVGELALSPEEMIALAAQFEGGHPDNVAASTLGGLAVVARREDGRMAAVSLTWPPEVAVLVAVPELRLPTEKARAVLPASYSRADAVANIQRAALFVASVTSGNFSLLRTAVEDRIHQPYRAPLVPGLKDALALDVPGLLGIALSGAGPSLVAFVTDPAPARAALEAIYGRLGIPCQVRSLAVAQAGVRYFDSE